LQSTDATYRPARDVEIIITRDGTRIFGGYTDLIRETSIGGEPFFPIEYSIDCIEIAEGTTLHAALTALVSELSDYGVTLDAGQVTGPNLPLIQYDAMSVAAILNEISTITGYIWRIDYNNVLKAYLPGTDVAPFNVVEFAQPETWFGDISLEPARTNYANRVLLRFGTGSQEVIDNFTGNGATTAFPINYFPLVAHRGYVNVGGTVDANGNVVGGANETLSIGGGGTWDYTPATGVVTRTSAVTAGAVVNFQYTAQFPITFEANDITEQPPVRDVIVTAPNIFNVGAAEQAAFAVLPRYTAQPRIAHYKTFNHGLKVGMEQTITVTRRGLAGFVGYITDISVHHLEGDHMQYTVTVLEGTLLQHSWRDVYGEWTELGGGGGAAITATAPPVVAGGPGGPEDSVQYHAPGGVFGGETEFRYIPEYNSVILGAGGSSITANDVESCFIFGYNCHIADP
jgi:hypothetical protein